MVRPRKIKAWAAAGEALAPAMVTAAVVVGRRRNFYGMWRCHCVRGLSYRSAGNCALVIDRFAIKLQLSSLRHHAPQISGC
jgi:hypothetical protein